ncbi:MAG: S-layer homology domain-containing protein [Oscillospiraceae bacterium]|nr:S-layer homology domain-containing protein [Oscillospiraceae bacterium]
MKIKRLAAAAVSVAVTASCMCTAVSAAAEDILKIAEVLPVNAAAEKMDDKLQKALETVKSRVMIPESYGDFSYSKGTSAGVDRYTFRWTEQSEVSSYNLGYISVGITGDVITSYSVYDPDYSSWTEPSFGRLTDKQVISAAENALKMLNPDIADEISIKEDYSPQLRSREVSLRLTRTNEGLMFDKNSGMIRIDKNTGTLRYFNLTWWNGAEFTAADKAVSTETIEEAYKKETNLIPYYRISENSKGDKNAAIVYTPDNNPVFDADTAKPTTMFDDYAEANNTSNYTLGSTVYTDEEVAVEEEVEEAPAGGVNTSSADKVTFTDAEKNALMESGMYYSKSDAVELLKKDKYLGLTDDYVLSSADFSKDDRVDSGYMWSFNFSINTSTEYRTISVKIDAESGRVYSFNKYNNNEPKKTINIKTVNKKAAEAAEYYIGDKFAEYKSSEKNTEKADGATNRRIIFNRYANDIQVSENDIRVTVNSEGEVMSFSYTYDDISFPEPKIITEDEAYKALFDSTDFDLYYSGFMRLDGKPKTYLLYSAEEYHINAETGRLCGYNGTEYTLEEAETDCPYTDISDNWTENYITKLYSYGITLSTEDNMFRPDEAITEREFAQLLDKLYYSDVMPILYGNYAYDNNSRLGNTPLTKAASAKLYIIAKGGKEFAELKGIYKAPFKDIDPKREDLGYIAMAYAMGAVKADSQSNFNPDSKVTRAYAMYLIYTYISNAKI